MWVRTHGCEKFGGMCRVRRMRDWTSNSIGSSDVIEFEWMMNENIGRDDFYDYFCTLFLLFLIT